MTFYANLTPARCFVDHSSCSITFTHSFFLFVCPSVQMASPQSLIWSECGPMSAWHQRRCQLDNDKIASDLSGIAFIVVIGVIYCLDVLKLCHALLGTLPFTLIGLATNCDRFHCWQTRSETLETAYNRLKSPGSYLLWGSLLFMWTNNMYIATQAHRHTKDTHTHTHIRVYVYPHSQTLPLPSGNPMMLQHNNALLCL